MRQIVSTIEQTYCDTTAKYHPLFWVTSVLVRFTYAKNNILHLHGQTDQWGYIWHAFGNTSYIHLKSSDTAEVQFWSCANFTLRHKPFI